MYLPRLRHCSIALAAALAMSLTSCSSDDENSADTEPTKAPVTTAPEGEGGDGGMGAGGGDVGITSLSLEDGWAKAVDIEKAEGDTPMTAVFGTLKNSSDQEVTVSEGSSPAAESVEMHLFEKDSSGNMVMKKTDEGFTLGPGESLELKPGGEHIMLIGLKESLKAGTDVTVNLSTDTGADQPITVPVREFTGADEDYDPGQN